MHVIFWRADTQNLPDFHEFGMKLRHDCKPMGLVKHFTGWPLWQKEIFQEMLSKKNERHYSQFVINSATQTKTFHKQGMFSHNYYLSCKISLIANKPLLKSFWHLRNIIWTLSTAWLSEKRKKISFHFLSLNKWC